MQKAFFSSFWTHFFALVTFVVLFWGCASRMPHTATLSSQPLALQKTTFDALDTWQSVDYAGARQSFQASCSTKNRAAFLDEACAKVSDTTLDNKTFFESYFEPHLWVDEKPVLITGYYEPALIGRRTRDENYTVAIRAKPRDLIRVDKSIYGFTHAIVDANFTVIPYPPREVILSTPPRDTPVAYVADAVEYFFLQVQGSGRIDLIDENRTIFVGYGEKNGHSYTSIGAYLIANGWMQEHNMSMSAIQAWAQEHPTLLPHVLNHNKSFLFMREKNQGATGAQGVPLTPLHSCAVDTRYIPFGVPIMLSMPHPKERTPYTQITIAQDRGAAILGERRIDYFWGFGHEAGALAGRTKAQGTLWLLLPKTLSR